MRGATAPKVVPRVKLTPKAESACRHFLDFAAFVYPGYQQAAHIEVMADHLEAVERGDILRSIITAPPGHSKSLNVSELFPAWYLGKHPDRSIILSSYEAGVAYTFSRSARNLVAEPEYREVFPGVELSPDSQAVGQWALAGQKRFSMVGAGVGGPITGKRANLFIIDDPVKNYQEAMSATYRQKTWDWWRSTARTRLEPDAAVVLIMTRWHESDLAGRMLRAMGEDPEADQWTVLSLPAIDEEGRALWPERYPIKALREARGTLGSWLFTAMYQGSPQPEEGNLIKREWFRFVPSMPDGAQGVRCWDLAATAKETQKHDPDRSASVFLAALDVDDPEAPGGKRRQYYVDRAVRGTWAPLDLDANVKAVAQLDGPNVSVGILAGAGPGEIIVSHFRKLLGGYLVRGVPEVGDKVVRSLPWRVALEAGNLFLVEGDWNWEFIEEMAAFPTGAHDDWEDSMSGAHLMLEDMAGTRPRAASSVRSREEILSGDPPLQPVDVIHSWPPQEEGREVEPGTPKRRLAPWDVAGDVEKRRSR